jgi:altered-inheritance-of-mitochondria protein 13
MGSSLYLAADFLEGRESVSSRKQRKVDRSNNLARIQQTLRQLLRIWGRLSQSPKATRYFITKLRYRCVDDCWISSVISPLGYRQFSQEVIDHLQESAGSPGTPPDRQSTLDAHIRARINAELGRLREEEKVVREQIEAALEKENLSREMAGTDGDGAEGGVTSSSSVQGALDEVQKKVDRFHAKQDISGHLLVSESSQKLIECYR